MSAEAQGVNGWRPLLRLAPVGLAFLVVLYGLRACSPVRAAERFRPLAEPAAERARIDPNLLLALVVRESGGDPSARSSAGAAGLTQLKLPAARDAAAWLGETPPEASDLLDPATSLRLGAAYLRILFDRFGDLEVALAAYLKGPRWVTESGGLEAAKERFRNSGDVRSYVARIFELSERLAIRNGER